MRLVGKRTSVALEEAFWEELERIARVRRLALNQLITDVATHVADGSALASSLRVFALENRTPRTVG